MKKLAAEIIASLNPAPPWPRIFHAVNRSNDSMESAPGDIGRPPSFHNELLPACESGSIRYSSRCSPGGSPLSQTAELARVKTRIKALTEKTVANGCTEAEAMSAAEMVGRLLERYALSMDEIEVREARCVQAEVPMRGQRRRPIDACVPAIARFCDCKVWLTRGARPKSDYDEDFDWTQPGGRYVFFGFETDTALATYLFTVIDRAIMTEATAFKAANLTLRGIRLRRASSSFQHGVAARVSSRLDEMHHAREASVRAQRSTGTALILASAPRR